MLYRRKHPDTGFGLSGVLCFCGVQGSGKTLSAVLYARQTMLAYPECICVTNLTLNFPDMSDRIFTYTGINQMCSISNGDKGVLFLLDEIQLEYNSLESTQMGNNVFELVSQQRKQRKHIVGTTQIFGRLAKPFREQIRNVVVCSNFRSLLFSQKVYGVDNVATDEDVNIVLKHLYNRYYFARPEFWGLYDTYAVIKRITSKGGRTK